ncbi:ATP-binding protein [Flavobacterium sp. LS1R47]|uniref:ATP-binding protein n=1 Tax=Flavobacterium frigoritolerans TaxID=2987686 RepID=A0A9X3CAB2_9FLAO|nr:ATP-binding protein [Flavobacterium frigoritolerans]MCV9934514.1 ATP-binding protein [Flavobacterium frigoritolerans]
MNLTNEFKAKVRLAILEKRNNYGGSDSDFSKSLGINNAVYSRLKSGEIDRILSDTVWITLGRELQVKVFEDNWKVARTSVYTEIEDNLSFCKELSRSMVLVDDCGIGKTFCTKHIIKKMKNTFFVDCSQAKSKQLFIRLLAKTIGIDNQGKYYDVLANLKYYITTLEKPLIILDEAGDLEYTAFLELKGIWNGTDGVCGWYMMGADGLRDKIDRGIKNKKVGFAEIFSRFSDEFIKLVPNGKSDRQAFYTELIGAVASANLVDKSKIKPLINKCINKETTLRYLETLIKIGA